MITIQKLFLRRVAPDIMFTLRADIGLPQADVAREKQHTIANIHHIVDAMYEVGLIDVWREGHKKMLQLTQHGAEVQAYLKIIGGIK
jgi:hypothetical protein